MEEQPETKASLRILVAEDEAVSLNLVSKIMSSVGHQVIAAANGKDALEYINSDANRVDIVITDALMPIMDGFQLLFHLKANPRTRRIPVILSTGLNDAESVKRGIALGAVDYIVKPLNPDLLLAKLQKAAGRATHSILVVDDEELLRDVLTNILARDGLRTLTASDGNEALKIIAEETPSLVISDMYMPNMDGMGLLKEIRSHYPRLPVLLVSGRPTYDLRRQAQLAGAVGLVSKPFKNDEIRRLVAASR